MSAPPNATDRAASPATPLPLDPRTYARGLACVHCGLCLPACPTYTETHHEGDSPRGRIQLMLGLSDGSIPLTNTVKHHLDLCLDCRACETACPSGVVYHELIEETRARFAERNPPAGLVDRLLRTLFFHVFTRPTRLKLALLPARVLQKVKLYPLLRRSGLFRLLPAKLAKMERLLPADGPLWPRPLPPHSAAGSMDDVFQVLRDETGAPPNKAKKVRVGFFETCVGGVMFAHVNRQAAELLVAAGADVIAPPAQRCCGAIHHHNGAHDASMDLARRNIDAFCPEGGDDVDWIVNTVAGCGAMLREYDVLLRDDPRYRDRAQRFVEKVRDVSEVLLAIGLPETKHPLDATVTYHDACHLAHAQRVTAPPRQLLAKIPGLRLVPLAESDMCCGAAGTYNLTQPEMATRLGERKLSHIDATGAGLCVTGNVGCAMHLQSEARESGRAVRIVHPIELLHLAVFGPSLK
jgi:glycolate oxidase iron-sulfur subunit